MAMPTVLDYCQNLPEKTLGPGETMLGEGKKEGVLYILIEGEVEVLKGDFQVNTVSEPGAIFGEMSVLLDMPHMATVKTLTACRAHVVERASEFLQSHTDISYELARMLAQRLHGITTYLVDLKNQFGDQKDHYGMIHEVLESLVHQQPEECTPGSERDPTKTL
jgi:CRP/FNR family cyclic AMP-dependent transcriptional regulator